MLREQRILYNVIELRPSLAVRCIVIGPGCGFVCVCVGVSLSVCVCVCVWVSLSVCGSVTTITRNCVHRSSPNWVCR